MDTSKILVNGEILPADQLQISPFDRGHLFGDGVFEVVPVYNGKGFALLPHLENLFASCIKMKIPAVYTVEELVSFHEELLAATGAKECEVYTQITRGVGSYNLEFPESMVPQLIMGINPVDRGSLQKLRARGVNLVTVPDKRGEACDINTIGRAQEIMAKQKAHVAKADDALFILGDKLTETTEATFMLVKDGMLWTYPEGGHIRKNMTRRIIKEKLAPALDMQVIEKAFTLDFALKAEEAFCAVPAVRSVPVHKIDRKLVAEGKPGTVAADAAKGLSGFCGSGMSYPRS
jgi:D-alanine transaminase